jgi:hypothetical protein
MLKKKRPGLQGAKEFGVPGCRWPLLPHMKRPAYRGTSAGRFVWDSALLRVRIPNQILSVYSGRGLGNTIIASLRANRNAGVSWTCLQ